MRYLVGFVFVLTLVVAPLSVSAQGTDEGWVEEFYPELSPREAAQPPPPESAPEGEDTAAEPSLVREPAPVSGPAVEAASVEAPSKDAADNYGLAYAGRELTMPRGMVRGTFDVSTLHLDLGFFGSENVVSLNFGAAISPIDDLELGFSRYRMGSFPGINFIDLVNLGGSGLISAFVSPEGDFGDIPFYVRYQPVSGTADVALEFRLRIPTLSEFGLAFGLPVRIHAGDSVAIDTGFDLTFDDPSDVKILSLGVPFQIVGNVSDNFFLELQTGVSLPDITTDPVVTVLPLGFTLGGSVDAGPVMLDAFFNFRLPTFAAFASGESEVTTEIWTITVGINVYSPVLF